MHFLSVLWGEIWALLLSLSAQEKQTETKASVRPTPTVIGMENGPSYHFAAKCWLKHPIDVIQGGHWTSTIFITLTLCKFPSSHKFRLKNYEGEKYGIFPATTTTTLFKEKMEILCCFMFPFSPDISCENIKNAVKPVQQWGPSRRQEKTLLMLL